MDQQLYDTLSQRRQDGTMPAEDARDFDALQQGGAFQQFQASSAPPPEASPAPATTTTTSAPPPTTTTQPPAAQAVAPAEPNDMSERPQVEMPQGAPPGADWTGGTVPRGLSYENTQRDFATGFADRAGLPPLKPADIGQLDRGLSTEGAGEFLTRALYKDPAGTSSQLGRALTSAAMFPGELAGAGTEAIAGRPAGDQAQYLTMALLPYLLGFRMAPKTMGAITGTGVAADAAMQLLHRLGR